MCGDIISPIETKVRRKRKLPVNLSAMDLLSAQDACYYYWRCVSIGKYQNLVLVDCLSGIWRLSAIWEQ